MEPKIKTKEMKHDKIYMPRYKSEERETGNSASFLWFVNKFGSLSKNQDENELNLQANLETIHITACRDCKDPNKICRV